LQPGIEINEYSSTRGNPSYQALYSARYLHSSRQSNLGYNLTLDELANVNAICAYPLLICTDASRTPCWATNGTNCPNRTNDILLSNVHNLSTTYKTNVN